MIYLKSTKTVFVPKSRMAEKGVVFSLKNTVSQMVIAQNVTELRSMELYFSFEVDLPAEMPSGEYEYTLSDDAGVLSTGLLIMGEAVSPTEYNKVIQYEQCK